MRRKKTRQKIYLDQQLFHKCVELGIMRLWNVYEVDQVFSFLVPDVDYPIYITIMGQLREQFGLNIHLGPYGLWNLQTISMSDRPKDAMSVINVVWGITFDKMNTLPPKYKRAIKGLSLDIPLGSRVPLLMVKEKGKHIRTMNKAEQRVALYFVSALIKHVRSKGKAPVSLNFENTYLTLELSGPPEDPDILADFFEHRIVAPNQQIPEIHPPESTRNAPRTDNVWIVGSCDTPVVIEDDDREISLMLVLDANAGLVLMADVFASNEIEHAAKGLFELFEGKKKSLIGEPHEGLPAEIIFADKQLYQLLENSMEELAIKSHFDDTLPAWKNALDNLENTLNMKINED